jgi:prepilin-type N-terminal cleavage/methylation domain-containing protein
MSSFPRIYPNKKNKLSEAAFTLVELLIAVSIFSVVSIAIYSTFNSGITVFRRVKNIDFTRQRILLKGERLARELRQQQLNRKPLFIGAKARISFASLSDYAPCRVTYYFDNLNNSLMRAVESMPEIITSTGAIDPDIKAKDKSAFLKNVKEVQFAYLFLDLQKNEYVWLEEWPYEYLPIAVNITIVDEEEKYVKTVFLPTA